MLESRNYQSRIRYRKHEAMAAFLLGSSELAIRERVLGVKNQLSL